MKKQSTYILLSIALALFLFSCGGSKTVNTAVDNAVIEKYLDEKVLEPSFGGKIYSSHKVFGTDGDKIFIWAYLQEYYKKEGKCEAGTGWSVPMVLNTSTTNGKLSIISHTVPVDGDMYSSDIKKLFPVAFHQQIFDFTGSSDIKDLEKRSLQRAEKE
jgi:hypothetical protein